MGLEWAFRTGPDWLRPSGLIGRLAVESVSHLALGAAFVLSGWYVAPNRKAHACLALGTVALLVDGALLLVAILTSSWLGVWVSVCVAYGVWRAVVGVALEDLQDMLPRRSAAARGDFHAGGPHAGNS